MTVREAHPARPLAPRNGQAPRVPRGQVQLHYRLLLLVVVEEGAVVHDIGAAGEGELQAVVLGGQSLEDLR